MQRVCARPFRGCTYYPVQTVILGLEHKLIQLDDIKFEFIPSDVLAPDHFVPYFDCIEKAFEGLEGTFTTSNTKSSKEYSILLVNNPFSVIFCIGLLEISIRDTLSLLYVSK